MAKLGVQNGALARKDGGVSAGKFSNLGQHNYYPPVSMPLWGQNDHIRGPKWRLGAEIIIHLWVLDRVPVLSDLIHFSSLLGTKVAAPTLENGTRSVSFDHGFILGYTGTQVKKRHKKYI